MEDTAINLGVNTVSKLLQTESTRLNIIPTLYITQREEITDAATTYVSVFPTLPTLSPGSYEINASIVIIYSASTAIIPRITILFDKVGIDTTTTPITPVNLRNWTGHLFIRCAKSDVGSIATVGMRHVEYHGTGGSFSQGLTNGANQLDLMASTTGNLLSLQVSFNIQNFTTLRMTDFRVGTNTVVAGLTQTIRPLSTLEVKRILLNSQTTSQNFNTF